MANTGARDCLVKWVGALRNVHHGLDFSGKIDLRDLAGLEHLYAVGPVQELQGEITIWDSTPIISEACGCNIAIHTTWNRQACFLVYAQVADWQAVLFSETITDLSISKQMQAHAQSHNLSLDQPFVFLLRGTARSVVFHVLNKTDDSPPDGTTQQLDRAKMRFSLAEQPVEMLGFYSQHHQGIFTHCDSFVHLHARTPDNKQAGHVEAFEILPGGTLYLPSLNLKRVRDRRTARSD